MDENLALMFIIVLFSARLSMQECPELKYTNETFASIECETDLNFELQTCNLTCKNGTLQAPWFEELHTLKCGLETNYSWVPPGIVQAHCIVPVLPDELRIDTEVTYSTIIPAEHQSEVVDKVMENIKETNCVQSTLCNTTVKLLSTQGDTDNKTKLELIFRRHINASYMFDENAREEIASARFDLESTAEYIKNSTSDIFDVSTDDGTFVVEDFSLRIQEIVNCSSGQVPLNGICVECPAGTFKKGSWCTLCPKGSFQWQTGQRSCIKCPSGHTTSTAGAVYEVQCVVHTEEKTIYDKDILSTGRNLAAILGPVLTIVVAGPTFVLFCYKMRERRKKQKEKKYSEQSSQELIKTFSYKSENIEMTDELVKLRVKRLVIIKRGRTFPFFRVKIIKVKLFRSDITKFKADAIVHPTDNKLSLMGKVGVALKSVGEKDLSNAVKFTRENVGTLRTSETAYTDVRHIKKLPFDYIIHVDSPIWCTDKDNNEELKKTLNNVLDFDVRTKPRVKSLSIPSIGSGDAHYPKDTAAEIILECILEYAKNIQVGSVCPLEKIYCVVYDDESVQAFEQKFDIVYNSRFPTTTFIT